MRLIDIWWMCFTYKGEQKRVSTEATDKKVAEKIFHKVMTEVAEGKWFERLPGRREEGAAPATVNKEFILMGHAFNLAIKEWEWIKDNPVSRVSREKVNNQRERCVLPCSQEGSVKSSQMP